MLSLRARLTSSYILVSLICIILISVLANLFLERQFRQYIRDNLASQNKQLISLISRAYHPNSQWNQSDITEIGMNALTQGLIIKLQGTDGSVIWDATQHNNGLCQEMMLHMAENMLSRYPNWKGGYVENSYPVVKNFKEVGTIKIGYYGPFYFKDTDLAFINTLNEILMGVTVLAIFIALFSGSFIAKRLSAPIAKVIHTAQEIATGNLAARSGEKTNIKEINQLTQAINNLGNSLLQQEGLRKRLTADVAHELRTPLATLQSHLEAMIDGIWKFDQQRLKVCHQEILRINRMVAELEKLTRYEQENLTLNYTRFRSKDLFDGIAVTFEPELHQKGVELRISGTDPWITGDRDKLNQVFINLIANSLKFTPKGGCITIDVIDKPDTVAIGVKDTGSGIAPDDLPYIFERFYRADKSRNRLTGGSGIGLAITKAIIEAHRGTIAVKSEVGVGSEFIITLPKGLG